MGERVNYGYINQYSRKNYDRITIIVPKGSKKRIQDFAKQLGKTTSDFIVGLIPNDLICEWKTKGTEI